MTDNMTIFLFSITIILIFLIALLVILFLNIRQRITSFTDKIVSLKDNQQNVERLVREEIVTNRNEFNFISRESRQEMQKTLLSFEDSLISRIKDNETSQKNQLEMVIQQLSSLTQMNEQKYENLRKTVEERLKYLQEENSKKLEQMRETVDEKLHTTLERRLGESFKVVSDRLESVYKGLGEMQNLASNVGDLKKVLTNVKTRGTLGEIQLGILLDQMLVPEQYGINVVTKSGSNERVEFAIKLPGGNKQRDEIVWLPIDAKFPQEDYQRLIEAQESANSLSEVDKSLRQLEIRIKAEAKDIKEKYIDPPHTTDFAIMYLPTEGLFAEVLRRPGLFDLLQREYRVIITGPTTLTAVLNSLQMGFRTLAIEKRSSEVWQLLGVVKTEFCRFGDILEKTQKKLSEARDTIDLAAKKTRTIENKLKNVQVLVASEENLNAAGNDKIENMQMIEEGISENKS